MTNDTVEIKLEGKEEDYFGTDALVKPRERVVTFGGDSDIPLKPDRSVKDLEVSPIKIIIMLKKAMSIGMSGGFKRHQPSTVIDPGAKQDIIGGFGWKILHLSDLYEPLQGPLQGMGTAVLPKVYAVTAVEIIIGK